MAAPPAQAPCLSSRPPPRATAPWAATPTSAATSSWPLPSRSLDCGDVPCRRRNCKEWAERSSSTAEKLTGTLTLRKCHSRAFFPLTPAPLPLSLIDTTHEVDVSLSSFGGEGWGEDALNHVTALRPWSNFPGLLPDPVQGNAAIRASSPRPSPPKEETGQTKRALRPVVNQTQSKCIPAYGGFKKNWRLAEARRAPGLRSF